MNPLLIAIDGVAAGFPAGMWRASWQGGLAMILVFALCRAVPGIPPAAQCWLWRLAYAKLLIAGLAIVPFELPWLPVVEPPAGRMPAESGGDPLPGRHAPGADAVIVVVPPASTGMLAAAAETSRGVRWLLLAWVAGGLFVLTNLLRRGTRVHRDVARLPVVTNSLVIERLDELRRLMRVTRRPQLRVSGQERSPFLTGTMQPTIVLPERVLQSDAVGRQFPGSPRRNSNAADTADDTTARQRALRRVPDEPAKIGHQSAAEWRSH